MRPAVGWALGLGLLLAVVPTVAWAGRDAEDVALQLGRELRCPVCQGMPIAESPSPMAQDMMRQVRRMLADGQSPEAVKAYYVERYGEWVLLRPQSQGLGLLVWLAPPGVALLLGGASFAALRQRRRAAAVTAGAAAHAAAPPPAELVAAIDRELAEGPDA